MPSFQVPAQLPRIQRGSQKQPLCAPYRLARTRDPAEFHHLVGSFSASVPFLVGAIRAELFTEPGPSPILFVPCNSGRIGRGRVLEGLGLISRAHSDIFSGDSLTFLDWQLLEANNNGILGGIAPGILLNESRARLLELLIVEDSLWTPLNIDTITSLNELLSCSWGERTSMLKCLTQFGSKVKVD